MCVCVCVCVYTCVCVCVCVIEPTGIHWGVLCAAFEFERHRVPLFLRDPVRQPCAASIHACMHACGWVGVQASEECRDESGDVARAELWI